MSRPIDSQHKACSFLNEANRWASIRAQFGFKMTGHLSGLSNKGCCASPSLCETSFLFRLKHEASFYFLLVLADGWPQVETIRCVAAVKAAAGSRDRRGAWQQTPVQCYINTTQINAGCSGGLYCPQWP